MLAQEADVIKSLCVYAYINIDMTIYIIKWDCIQLWGMLQGPK